MSAGPANLCPHESCAALLDVPTGSFDGAAFLCPGCYQESFLVVCEDGSWFLDAGADDHDEAP